MNAQIIGVSGDDMETLHEFVKEKGVSFPLVSDETNEIKANYGRGRVTYLIDKEGIIRFIQKGVPNNKDFIKQLELLQ